MKSARYTVDLAAHIAECELNYLRIRKLLPNLEGADRHCFGLPGAQIKISVTERARYTTTLQISQSGAGAAGLPAPSMEVRVYHDAVLAEVVACQGVRRASASNHYPNEKMLQRDEKRQWNRFLGEWLSFCLSRGRTLSDPLQTSEI